MRIRKLAGDRCYLSPPCLEDAEPWTAWEADLDVALPLGGEAYGVPDVGQTREWIGEILRQGQHVYSVLTLEGDRLIGRGMLMQIDKTNRSAMLGLVIGEKDHWGQGYGVEATRLLLDVAFSLLNLHSVHLGAFSFNTRALRCYERVGFRPIGRRREARLIGGRAYDIVEMDMLASEFASPYVRRHMPD